MPLQIDEIAIRMEVGGAPPTAGQPGSAPSDAAPVTAASAQEAIVEECVRRVLRALAERGGR